MIKIKNKDKILKTTRVKQHKHTEELTSDYQLISQQTLQTSFTYMHLCQLSDVSAF